jgi:hypothetical protein
MSGVGASTVFSAIVGPIESQRPIDAWQHNLKFGARGHANVLGSRHDDETAAEIGLREFRVQ